MRWRGKNSPPPCRIGLMLVKLVRLVGIIKVVRAVRIIRFLWLNNYVIIINKFG